MTTTELAAYLQVPINTIYSWRNGGTGPPAIRVGRHLRYRFAEVDQWLTDQQGAPPNGLCPKCGAELGDGPYSDRACPDCDAVVLDEG